MAIEVRHDSGQGLAANMQSAVQSRAQNLRRQQSGEVAQSRPPSVPGSLVQGTQPGEPRLGPAQQAMIAFEAGNITDSFNSWLDAFDAYEIPPDQKGRFESTWRELMADPGLTHEQRMAGLTQVLERAQVMVDSSPRKRDRRQEWLESLRENPSPFVIDPQSGEMIANPFEQQRRIETREQRLQQGVEIREQAQALRERVETRQQQQQEEAKQYAEVLAALREQQTELTRLRAEQLREMKAGGVTVNQQVNGLHRTAESARGMENHSAEAAGRRAFSALSEINTLEPLIQNHESQARMLQNRAEDPSLDPDLRTRSMAMLDAERSAMRRLIQQRSAAQQRHTEAQAAFIRHGDLARAYLNLGQRLWFDPNNEEAVSDIAAELQALSAQE